MHTFLPKGYTVPKSSGGYMKLIDGDNKFRILSAPILGWEDRQDKKPVRFRFDAKPTTSIDPEKKVKHFWAMIVWNFGSEDIEILEITQSSIKKALEALCSDEDWGAPYFYDIKVNRSGEALNTEYAVNPAPHRPLPSNIRVKFYEKRCNLEALFDGADPFSPGQSSYTDGIFSTEQRKAEPVQLSSDIITELQAADLVSMLTQCTDTFHAQVLNWLKTKGITSLEAVPVSLYADLHKRIEKEALGASQSE